MGLATCGAWIIFDNFQRLHIETLSVIAEQLRTLELAIAANVQQFIMDGKTISIHGQCFICATNMPNSNGICEM